MTKDEVTEVIWRSDLRIWLYFFIASVLVAFAFHVPIQAMVKVWGGSEEYGYGYIIPFLSLFFIWQRKDDLSRVDFGFSFAGLLFILLGGLLLFLGELATTHALSQYGLVVTVHGIFLSVMGWKAYRIIMVPLAILFFMVPLPQFIYQALSIELQLVSSSIGVAVIRLFDISVYLEGNVIDLGSYKLQVVEACSGLRYLFPLVSLSFIAAYIYKGAFWKKAIIFLSSIPITVLMNSFRIGVIGVLVEYGGPEQAEGFLHDFEGWIVFMACILILVLEMAVLAKLGSDKRSLADAFALDFPEPAPEAAEYRSRQIRASSWIAPVLLGVLLTSSIYVQGKENIIPDRQSFAGFPLKIADWKGTTSTLEENILESLDTEDYIISDFVNKNGDLVNFYVAYYADQAADSSAHSPRACIPGGGWLVEDLTIVDIDGIEVNGRPLSVNRLLIKRGDYTSIVYYWFHQRGRNISNEWMVKWYLFWDSLTRNRTDGALVRLTTFVAPGQNEAAADERIVDFANTIFPFLSEYIPD